MLTQPQRGAHDPAGGVPHPGRRVGQRQIELQSFSAEQRFRSLMARSPHILHLVPHKYLASYLGLDPTNFSKFLGTIKL